MNLSGKDLHQMGLSSATDSPILSTKHKGKIIEGSLVDCTKCGFIHQYPFIEQDYSDEYFSKIKPNFVKEHEADKQWFNKIVFKDIFDTVESYLDKRQKRVLDIGAGWMGFLRYAIHHGWDAVGLDPSLQAYKAAKQENIPFYRGNYDENCLHLGIFDFIDACEVLEHIISPKEFILQVQKQLELEGIFVVTVPNDFNVLQTRGTYFIAKEHINYFTIDSLSNLLKNNGFEILEVRTHFPLEMFLFMGIDYLEKGHTGRRVNGYRKKWELNLDKAGLSDLRHDFDQFWTDRGLGRDIVITARKV